MMEVLDRVFYMSVTASCIVMAVLGLRWLLRRLRLPKGFSYALWIVVLFRFLCPASIPSPFSLVPVQAGAELQQMVDNRVLDRGESLFDISPRGAGTDPELVAADGAAADQAAGEAAGETVKSPGQPVTGIPFLLLMVWLTGMVSLLSYGLFSYYRLRRQISTAVRVERGVYESDRISGAFVVGFFRPVIYLPSGLDEADRRYILCHERIHIARRDYLVKLAGTLMAAIHWFNPLAWVSFHLMCRDMEMSCDERVLKTLGMKERQAYSMALLHAAGTSSGLAMTAFGESSTKIRIKNILNYRKPQFWVSLLVAALLLCVGIGLVTDPAGRDQNSAASISIIGGADGPTSIFIAGKLGGGDEQGDGMAAADYTTMPDEEWLANTYFAATFPGEDIDYGISLDVATENNVVFHGDFGLFSFECVDGVWEQKLFLSGEDAEAMAEVIAGAGEEAGIWSDDSVHREDRLRETGSGDEFGGDTLYAGWQDFDGGKMANGKIAFLGGYAEDEIARLVDVFYAYYDPEEQVVHQIYPFLGETTMTVNPPGEIRRHRYEPDGLLVEETAWGMGRFSEDAGAVEQIAEEIFAAYFKGDMDTIRSYAADINDTSITLYEQAGADTEVPVHRIHGLTAIKEVEINGVSSVWCSFGGSPVEAARDLKLTFVKTADGWKLEAMELMH